LRPPRSPSQSRAPSSSLRPRPKAKLTTIALPHDWCGYGEIIAELQGQVPGLKVNELNPDAGSGDEIEAIKANKDNKGPQAPDVIDVGLSFGTVAKKDGLIQPYKVATWDSKSQTAPRMLKATGTAIITAFSLSK
jgi:putative spermidine/putrescine transport system substrate-binding protein